MSKNTHSDKAKDKKAAVLGTGKKSRAPLFITLCAAIVLAGGAFYFLSGSGDNGPAKARAVSAAKTNIKEFVYPVNYFDDGQAHFYSYETEDGITIRYFILKSSDGVIRAAFDACDSCWAAGKGYKQDGDFMVCNNCGLTFASVKVNEVRGGCNPSPLTRTIKGDKVVIKVSDIVSQGRPYFDFS